ncbi:hypothetical protein SRB5_41030 [Streptomyces sp. RB5]|uniref:DUF4232 domain-containing protein n=1 Tax=Streptomyces smaragdinus TaxID=2585196 RepID=A0A7K0CL04_9ACTN|nr:hypothetical protein [Streptomyces smaragdinus]MQY13943.1 hypothetical protein [Streptomyces smaragdinus]
MRPRLALAAAVAAGAVALVPGAVAAGAEPGCGGRDFPLEAELSGGPQAYEAGGAPGGWTLTLRNTTRTTCRAVHPVAVLVDDGAALTPAHIRLAFRDEAAGRWRAVRFRETDRAENVGVFAGRGFTVRAGREVTVRVRLAFTGDAPAGAVTATVSAMRRQAGDGVWAGQSRAYAFAVTEPGTGPRTGPGGGGTGERGAPLPPGADATREPGDRRTPAAGGKTPPSHDGPRIHAPDTSTGAPRTPSAADPSYRPDRDGFPWSLANSGSGPMAGIGCTAGAFLLGGGAFLVGSRRLDRTPASRSHHR